MLFIDLDGITVQGMLIHKKSIDNNEIKNNLRQYTTPPSITILPVSNFSIDENVQTVSIGSDESENEQLCGGKGSSLGFLKHLSENKLNPYQFIVPSGFIVTSTAYKKHINNNAALDGAIKNVENIAYKRSVGSLQEVCDHLVQLFEEIAINDGLITEIKNRFTEMGNGSNSLRVAVRSSAIGEDSAETSVAGQNETFLGVKSFDEVLKLVQKCWASLFAYRSVVYRVQNALPVRAQMAVVIQSMVSSDSAGVLFTHHPVNNNPNKILISANYGLGEVSIKILIHSLFALNIKCFCCSLLFLVQPIQMFLSSIEV